jgi:hypothetical protein
MKRRLMPRGALGASRLSSSFHFSRRRSPFARQEPLHRTRILPEPRRLRRFSTSDARFALFNIKRDIARDTAIPPVLLPTSAHGSLNIHISVSLAFCPQDGRVQFAAEDENGSDHVEKDECDHHRRETRVGGNVIARELGEVGAEGNARRDP